MCVCVNGWGFSRSVAVSCGNVESTPVSIPAQIFLSNAGVGLPHPGGINDSKSPL